MLHERKPPSYDGMLTVVLVGEAGVGKTALMNRLVHNTWFPTLPKPSKPFVEEASVILPVRALEGQRKQMKLQLYDLNSGLGMQQFLSGYLEGAHVICFVCDINQRDTLAEVSSWLQYVPSSENAVLLLVANKADFFTTSSAAPGPPLWLEVFARENGIHHAAAVSAKTGEGVLEAFQLVCAMSLRQSQVPYIRDTTDLPQKPQTLSRFCTLA